MEPAKNRIAKTRPKTRPWLRALLAGIGIATLTLTARGAVAPDSRVGENPAQRVSTSLVSGCGLAVMLVVEPHGERAALYAGEAMSSKLRELGLQDAHGAGYDLADVYEPINASCHAIRAEHERQVHEQARKQPTFPAS